MHHPQLNQEQLAIVFSECPRIQVHACPGSGKTTTLIACVKHWVEQGVDPASILVLSFSNAAVANVEAKLKEQGIHGLTVHTIHALGLQLIPDKPAVLTDKERMSLLQSAINAAVKNVARDWPHLSASKQRSKAEKARQLLPKMRPLLHLFSLCSALGDDDIKDLAHTRFGDLFSTSLSVLPIVLKHYNLAKREVGDLDFEDMIALAISHVERSDAKWTHILVDEQQDCTAAQGDLVSQLVRTTGAMFRSFGDPAQAIFGFAGAEGVDFRGLLDDCELKTLTLSQRLPRRIAALATAIGELPDSAAIESRRKGGALLATTCESEIDMAKRVCTLVKRQLAADPESTVAVLARTKAQTYRIDQALRAQGIWAAPTRQRRRAVSSVLHWSDWTDRVGCTTASNVEDYLSIRWSGIASDRLTGTVKRLRTSCKSSSLSGRFRQAALAYMYAYGGELEDSDRKALRNDLSRWLPSASRAESPRAMWNEIRRMEKANVGRVHLSTIHASKGLEWDTVIVVGVTEGVLPTRYSKDDWALKQEQNLLYVAISRAKKGLHLFHAPTCCSATGKDLNDWSSIFMKSASSLVPIKKSQRYC